MPSILRTRFASDGATLVVPARRRVCSLDLTSSRCRIPAFCRSSLPDPVTLIRFLVPLWVLFLGMENPSSLSEVTECGGSPAGFSSGLAGRHSLDLRLCLFSAQYHC